MFGSCWSFSANSMLSMNEVMPTQYRGYSHAIIFVLGFNIDLLKGVVILPGLETLFGGNTALYYYVCLPLSFFALLVVLSGFKATRGIDLTEV